MRAVWAVEQHWEGPVQEIRPGDTGWIPPGVKHWQGASAGLDPHRS